MSAGRIVDLSHSLHPGNSLMKRLRTRVGKEDTRVMSPILSFGSPSEGEIPSRTTHRKKSEERQEAAGTMGVAIEGGFGGGKCFAAVEWI